jgi:hypothetical protein
MFATVNFGGVKLDELTFEDVTVDEIDDTALALGLTVGSDNRLDSEGRIWLCPLGAIAYRMGPTLEFDFGGFDFDDGVDTNLLTLGGGGRIGVVALDNGSVQAIPTFGISFLHERLTLEIPDEDDESDSETFGMITMGVGLVFNEQTALIPTFEIPLGREEDQILFRLTFVINFGG